MISFITRVQNLSERSVRFAVNLPGQHFISINKSSFAAGAASAGEGNDNSVLLVCTVDDSLALFVYEKRGGSGKGGLQIYLLSIDPYPKRLSQPEKRSVNSCVYLSLDILESQQSTLTKEQGISLWRIPGI